MKKKYNETRKKAVNGLVDFNNFIRDVVVEQSQMTVIDDERKKAVNFYNALVNDSKSVFYATEKITRHLWNKQETHYIKKTLCL